MNVGMMACYDQAKETVMTFTGDKDPKRPSLSTKLASSAIAGFTAAAFSMPFDLMKSRLQDMKPNANGELPYTGLLDAAGKILTKEGPMAFYTGFGAYYFRCAPHAMTILLTIEYVNSAGPDEMILCAFRHAPGARRRRSSSVDIRSSQRDYNPSLATNLQS
eukprot:scaffold1166_cov261-Pinguiococcus_pyrenoidosus.AAC.8